MKNGTSGFKLILLFSGSNFNNEYLIGNVAMATLMHILKHEGLMDAQGQ